MRQLWRWEHLLDQMTLLMLADDSSASALVSVSVLVLAAEFGIWDLELSTTND